MLEKGHTDITCVQPANLPITRMQAPIFTKLTYNSAGLSDRMHTVAEYAHWRKEVQLLVRL